MALIHCTMLSIKINQWCTTYYISCYLLQQFYKSQEIQPFGSVTYTTFYNVNIIINCCCAEAKF